MFAIEWKRDDLGYEVDGEWVRRRGGQLVTYDPLEHTGLYQTLADKTPDAIGACEFAEKFGVVAATADADQFLQRDFNVSVMRMRKAIRAAQNSDWHTVAKLAHLAIAREVKSSSGIEFAIYEFTPAAAPRFETWLPTLLTATWVQFLQDSREGTQIRKCGCCSNYVKYGRATGRRRGKYCSNKCRNAANYRLRTGKP